MNNTIIISLLIAFGIIFICSLFFIFRKKEKISTNQSTITDKEIIEEDQVEEFKNQDIITEHEIEVIPQVDNIEIPTENSFINKEEPKLSISISSKTEKTLLNKLKEFEESKAFTKKDVNLNNLAKKFDTNTKYLSEIIKTYKNKNFNHYLNDLRINHLISELNNNEKVLNTKVSYLASDFGFSSHSTFSTIFTQYIGQTPSEYIKNLKKSKAENNQP